MAKKLGGLGKGLNAIFIENDNEENNGTVVLKFRKLSRTALSPERILTKWR